MLIIATTQNDENDNATQNDTCTRMGIHALENSPELWRVCLLPFRACGIDSVLVSDHLRAHAHKWKC